MSTSTQISENQTKKSHKTDRCKIDYLSNLPDGIISQVLSRLSTRSAVRTSVLAKDWRYKWTSIYNIDLFYFPPFYDARVQYLFRKFVTRTLHLRKQGIQRFRLSCHGEPDLCVHIKTWILSALNRGVRCLDIDYQGVGLVLPDNLFDFHFLRKLILDTPCAFKVFAKVCFPHLTTLELANAEILNDLSISDPVKFSFPVLEKCELRECKWLNVKVIEIIAPKMSYFCSVTKCGGDVTDYSIKIVGDSVVKFRSYGGLPENIALSDGSKVVSADLNNDICRGYPDEVRPCGFHIRKLLNGFAALICLKLSRTIAEALALSRPAGLSLPKFYKMERLELYSVSNSDVLIELLHAAPFLKFLVLSTTRYWIDMDYDTEESVPVCIISHLEEVTLRGFPRKMEEIKLVKFILKSAENLKSLRIGFKTNAKELLTFKKASSCVNIVVT